MSIPNSIGFGDQTPTWRLSQSHLNRLDRCPRQYQYTFLDALGSPPTPERQENLQRGSEFHQLMQQWSLGLPITPFLSANPAWESAFGALQKNVPELGEKWPQTEHYTEHCRTFQIDNYLFTVIFDLLIVTPTTAHILDWKTHTHPQKYATLTKDWQTRLYLYVLAQTSTYQPEQLRMTYWFIHGEEGPTSVTFTYDRQQHQQTQTDLTLLLKQLPTALDKYQNGQEEFPQVPQNNPECLNCSFAERCGRNQTKVPLFPTRDSLRTVAQDTLVGVANMTEISISS